MDTKEIRQLLADRIVIVTFTKADGSERRMHCTTKLDLIPPVMRPTGKVNLSEETEQRVIRAYDIQVQGWRSFKVESVKEIE